VVTVSATDAAWLRVPEVPVKVIVAFPAAAVAAAVSVIFWAAPGVRFKVEGVTLTPVGRPEAATDTAPEKLLTAVAVTLIDTPAPPLVTVTVPGVAAREKSAGGGGAWVAEPPPHERIARQKTAVQTPITG
jgi:hypothetical protein